MEYNREYIYIKYNLIKCFLFEADKNILDISYSIYERTITLQVVLLKGSSLSNERMNCVKEKLSDFNVFIKELYLTKEQFNESIGEWQPSYYEWLDYLLFSKAEVL